MRLRHIDVRFISHLVILGDFSYPLPNINKCSYHRVNPLTWKCYRKFALHLSSKRMKYLSDRMRINGGAWRRSDYLVEKLGHSLSEKDGRTFVTTFGTSCWLLRLKLSRDKLYFRFACETPGGRNWLIISLSDLTLFCCFRFCVVRSLPKSYFGLNQLRIVRKKCFHSTFSYQGMFVHFFDQKFSPRNAWVFRLLWAPVAAFKAVGR